VGTFHHPDLASLNSANHATLQEGVRSFFGSNPDAAWPLEAVAVSVREEGKCLATVDVNTPQAPSVKTEGEMGSSAMEI
jgi:hypothetical protein